MFNDVIKRVIVWAGCVFWQMYVFQRKVSILQIYTKFASIHGKQTQKGIHYFLTLKRLSWYFLCQWQHLPQHHRTFMALFLCTTFYNQKMILCFYVSPYLSSGLSETWSQGPVLYTAFYSQYVSHFGAW